MSPVHFDNKTSKFDLYLSGQKLGNQVIFAVEYCTAIFRKSTIQTFMDYFVEIIRVMITGMNVKVGDIVVEKLLKDSALGLEEEEIGDFSFSSPAGPGE